MTADQNKKRAIELHKRGDKASVIAAKLGLSISELQRLFKTEVGFF
ncbi:hypothetical protein ACED47_16980 [Vibrio splendidus]